ncbi:uncharacterized protein LOC117221446 isoform X4 [Megalopta genalis]|uniref:uncharacterized protein LOC117221446 isoform X4 n=1 Tax=Megalopta genalis TaxID=115081 RepID=UPI0014431904|nr:uncharacterized protein LOC117221446 isoform X4 [Megalopta genalis]
MPGCAAVQNRALVIVGYRYTRLTMLRIIRTTRPVAWADTIFPFSAIRSVHGARTMDRFVVFPLETVQSFMGSLSRRSIYFAVLALTTGNVLQGESQYLRGNRSLPESDSFLESDTMSPTTMRINVALLLCSCCGVVCSIMLLYGLFKSTFDPAKVMLFTLNFFLLCLNIYSLLCVVSQYQEYMAGRGTAAHDYEYRVSILRVSRDRPKQQRDKGRKVPAVRYATQPTTTTATSCLSSRRTPTNNETKTTATPTQSPTAGRNASEKSPVTGRPARKHVQFPDTAFEEQKVKSESSTTILISKKDSEAVDPTPSSPMRLEDQPTIDQSQRNSLIRHT